LKEKLILLVEDNPDDIHLTEPSLKKNYIANKMIVTGVGAAALDYLFGCDQRTSPALILLDLDLTKVNGLELLKRVRAERLRQLPVVSLTSIPPRKGSHEWYAPGPKAASGISNSLLNR
jgi:two-component system response regulator